MRFAIALGLVLAAVGSAQQSDKIWQGIFTAAQAGRGAELYRKSCSNCHNQDLKGSVRAPALRGDGFMGDWLNGSVNTLYSKIRFSMPATYPESVSDSDKLDILTYLLQVNGFPAGAGELKQDPDELDAIQIVKQGSHEIPNFALVEVVGCLEQAANKKWTLTRTTEPVVTRETEPVARDASTEALGTRTFLLVSTTAFKPESYAGSRVVARGLYYVEPGESRLNLTALQPAGGGCGR